MPSGGNAPKGISKHGEPFFPGMVSIHVLANLAVEFIVVALQMLAALTGESPHS